LTLCDNGLTLDGMTVIRSAGLRGFRETVRELGGDADRYAEQAGLPVEALDEDDLLVPDIAVAEVLEIAARELERPDLGLLVASRQDLGMLGPLALAIQNSPTLADALECTSRYLFVHARALSLALVPDPYGARGVVALRYGMEAGDLAPVQGTDLGLAFLHRALQSLVAQDYGLRSVELPYRPVAALEVYEEFFGATVRVSRPAALLRVPGELASRSLAGGDPSIRRLALAFLDQQAAESGPNLVPKVRGALHQSLGTSTPDVGAVARLLAMHPRTLQRRLADEGTTFVEILDEVRKQLARRYLTSTDLPLGQVAALLGLSEQSALSRCCRRWWDTTPSAVRKAGAATPFV
jgi:AraC-like DNA-binding protein